MARVSKEIKKEKRMKMVIGFITIFVMVSGGLGIFANEIGTKDNLLDYNEYEFERTDNGWMTETGGDKSYFLYHPLDVENILVEGDFKTVLVDADTLYLSNNPNSPLAVQIARTQEYFSSQMNTFFTIVSVNGFSVNSTFDVPVVTCEDSSKESPVIMFEEGNALIKTEGNCIKVYGQSDSDFARIMDMMLYSAIGIIGE